VKGQNLNDLIKSDGPLSMLGWPSHVKSMDDKYSNRFKTEKEGYIEELDTKPITFDIEDQIRSESQAVEGQDDEEA
jgi:hypothetical protein